MNKTKMTFILKKDGDGYPPDDTETVWVEDLGKSQYRIDNIPFYIRDISPDDIVEGEFSAGRLVFRRLLIRSKLSVIRVIFFDQSKSDIVMASLVANGCRWEGSHLSNLYSVELPPSVKLEAIRSFLDLQTSYDVLDYEEASIRTS
jgi:hypothetical protein